MTCSIVNEEALDRFIESADLDEARRTEAALTAMAAAVRLRVIELESRAGGSVVFLVDSPVRTQGGTR